MSKSEWGKKCVCQSCGTKFYDMKKSSVLCPNCNEPYEVKPTKSAETRAAKSAAAAAAKSKPKSGPDPTAKADPPPPSMDDDDTEPAKATDADEKDLAKDIEADDSDDDEEEPIEDASELGRDQDDVSEVVETKVEPEAVER